MTQSKAASIREVYARIRPEVEDLEKSIAREFSSEWPFIDGLIQHISKYAGKRLRPALVFFAARCFRGIHPDHVPLATVCEMIHTATLVHDDVIDEAAMRRNVPTVNRRWSNEVAVLLGDHIFSHAFYLSLKLGTTRAAEVLSRTTNIMVGGELLQVDARARYELQEPGYYQIIGMKTAELTGACAQLGALYAGSGEEAAARFHRYGYNLGMAFQIVDDYLDIMGEENVVGKTLGTDLAKGKMTLPIIRLLAVAPEALRDEILQELRRAEGACIPPRLRDWLREYAATDYTFTQATRFVEQALDAIAFLPESPDKDSLRALAEFVIARNY